MGLFQRIFFNSTSEHGPAFRAVGVIAQLALENGEPLLVWSTAIVTIFSRSNKYG